MAERMSEYLAALVDGKRIDWPLLEQRLGADSAGLARLRRVAEIIETFAVGTPTRAGHGGMAWGHLRVFESIGKGSHGEVHRAFDPLLEREVALKLRRDDALHSRVFIAEARRLARVRHQNVLAVHGAAIHDGRAGLWSDLIAGQSLADWVRRDGPRSVAEILSIASALAAALGAVHAAGLVHGDVKPGNIMREDAGGRIVLMDFGSAGDRADAERHGLLGSPASMSPEQSRGDPVGPAADLYSLGVVVYYLATGTFPNRSTSSIDATLRNVPRALHGVLSELLAHDPRARPDATQLRRRLWDIVDAPRRRRRRAAVGAVIASLALGLSVSVYALVRVEAERAGAVLAREQEAAVNGFLRDMLSAPSPYGEGAEVRVVDVLDAAVFDARQRFADKPRLRLSILRTVGDSYRDLELWEPARAVLVDALALSRTIAGPYSESSLDIEAILRHVEARTEPYANAQAALLDLYSRARRHLGDGHKITVDTALSLSHLLRQHPDTLDRTHELLEFVLAQRPAGTTDAVGLEQRITALIYLVSLKSLYGQDDEGGELLARATEAERRLPADWSTIRSALRTSLAIALARHGRLGEAEAEFRALLEVAESRLGPAHRNLRIRLNNLGYVLVLQHKYQEAVPILERAVALGEQHGGPMDSALQDARDSLADALAGAGRLEEAGEIREKLYADAVRGSGADHPFTLTVALGLADQYVRTGRGREAVALATETAERAARVFHPDHEYALDARELVARGRFVEGGREGALGELAEVCDHKARALGADSQDTANCNAHRAELLADAGDRAGASRLLGETIERNAARYGAEHPSTLALRERLAALEATSLAKP